ncbi:MAG TPA: STAS domain-containing protein [Jatrophihabitans sp.]|nr:STAS domain-containing protein [Jatrophihabitans sp.]
MTASPTHHPGTPTDWRSIFTTHADAGSSTVHARGRLDMFTFELLRGTIEHFISAGRVDITVDLTELTSIDHTALLMLGGLRHDLDYRGGSLTLTSPQPEVRVALDAAHLTAE